MASAFATFTEVNSVILVRIKVTTPLTEETIETFLADLAAATSKRRGDDDKFAMVLDARGVEKLPLGGGIMLARKISAFMTDNQARFQQCARATAIIVSSALLSGVMSAAFKIKKPSSPVDTFRDVTTAKAFLEKHGAHF